MSDLHAPPGFCQHATLNEPPCECPDFDGDGDDPLFCDTCEHQLHWHLPTLRLSQDQGRALKSRGEDAYERCKDKLRKAAPDGSAPAVECPCPVFVPREDGAKDCAICSHKAGWHKWKDSGPASMLVPTPSSPASSGTGSSFGSSPQGPWPPGTVPFHLSPQSSHSQLGGSSYVSPNTPYDGAGWSPAAGGSQSSQASQSPQTTNSYIMGTPPRNQAGPSFVPPTPSLGVQRGGSFSSAHSTSSSHPRSTRSIHAAPSIHSLRHQEEEENLETIGSMPGGFAASPVDVSPPSWTSAPASASASEAESPVEPRLRAVDKGKNVVRDPPQSDYNYNRDQIPPLERLVIPSGAPRHSIRNNPPSTLPPTQELPSPPSDAEEQRNRLSIASGLGSTTNRLSQVSFSGRRAPEDEYYLPEPVQPLPIAPPASQLPSQDLNGRRVLRQGSVPVPGVYDDRNQTNGPLRTTPSRRQPLRTETGETTPSASQTPRPTSTAPPPMPPQPPPLGVGLTLFNSGNLQHRDDPSPPPLAAGPSNPSRSSVPPPLPPPLGQPSHPGIGRAYSGLHDEVVTATEIANAYLERQAQTVGPQVHARAGSVSSQASGRPETTASVEGVVNFDQHPQAPVRQATLPPAAVAPLAPLIYQEYETKGKNVTLSVSPGLEAGRFRPGQIFHLKLSLGPKVSLSNFDKIDVQLVGNSLIQSEPPDNHDFLVLQTSILPLSEGVKKEPGDRVFSWQMTLPFETNCNCRNDPLPLPPSYGHSYFASRFRFKVNVKKHSKLIASKEKNEFGFVVDAPYVEVPTLVPTPSVQSERGVDGPWRTTTASKLIRVNNQQPVISSQELAYQIVHPPNSTVIRIPYRITLNLGRLPDPLPVTQQLNQEALDKFADTARISLSRKTCIYKSGRFAGDHPQEIRDLPMLLVTFKDHREGSQFVYQGGKTLWRVEGYLELQKNEARSMTSCNVSVRYVLTAKALASVGFSHPVEIYARSVNLEMPTTEPEPQRANSIRSLAPSQASVEPVPFQHRPVQPFAPVAGPSGERRGVQLFDGPRPPSIAGSSFFRIPLHERGIPESPTLSDDHGAAGGSGAGRSEPGSTTPDLLPPPPGPAPVPNHVPPAQVPASIPPTPQQPSQAPPPDSGVLDLPPDFDFEVPIDHEATPAYTAFNEADLVEDGLNQ
ncbi:hypothetical protein T439DRAFT_331196 [Meredithblackwellia eburnea MCA 4105]